MSKALQLLTPIFEQLRNSNQRGLIRLVGDQLWGHNFVEHFEKDFCGQIISFLEPNILEDQSIARKNEWRLKKFRQYLGQECDVLVYDAYQGFNADAFAALSGLVKLGGVVLLITPDNQNWLTKDDPETSRFLAEKYSPSMVNNYFIQHFLNVLSTQDNVFEIHQTTLSKSAESIYQTKIKREPETTSATHLVTPSSPNSGAIPSIKPEIDTLPSHAPMSTRYKTSDQERVAMSIQTLLDKPVSENSLDSLLVCADRGRGKSSVIGIALATYMVNHREINFVLTGPGKDSVDILQQHFNQHAHQASSTLNFVPADILIDELNSTVVEDTEGSRSSTAREIGASLKPIDLIVIDEAAAMPISMVQKLVSHSKKAILATTVHGYEGTGRGFEFKLKPWLKESSNSHSLEVMSTPIRWATNDSLENLVNSLFCLKPSSADSASGSPLGSNNLSLISNTPVINHSKLQPDLRFEWTNSQQLISYGLISGIFSLLSVAHYKTSPNDLRAILDSPSMRILTVYCDDKLIGTVLISLEGGLDREQDKELIQGILEGKRRPRGHLAPQSLVAHCGFEQAAYYRYARVVRIAVHPNYQSQKIGEKTLAFIEKEFEREKKIDFLTTSYGCDARLLAFWQKSGFVGVRLGLSSDASTGLASILMLKVINSSSLTKKEGNLKQEWLDKISERFKQTLQAELKVGLRSEESFIPRLLTQSRDVKSNLNNEAWHITCHQKDLQLFAFHHRSPDSVLLAMTWALNNFKPLINEDELSALIDKYVNGLSTKELVNKHQVTGEKQLVKLLRQQTALLLAMTTSDLL